MNDDLKLKPHRGSFLGIKEIPRDLKALPVWFKWMLAIGSVLILFFNFFDIQGGGDLSFFIPINQYNAVLAQNSDGLFINYSTFGHSQTAAIMVTLLYCLNGIAAFTGVVAISMIVFAKPSQFFWFLINSFFLALFVLSVGYVGDFFMNMIKFITVIPAWYLVVTFFRNNKIPNRGKWFLASFWTGIVLLVGLMIMMWLFFIPEASKWIFGNEAYSIAYGSEKQVGDSIVQGMEWGPQHIIDGMGSGASFIAWIFQAVNLGEQFYLWCFVDLLNFIKFTGVAPGTLSINMLIQFGVYVAFDLAGIYERILRPIFLAKGWIKQPNGLEINPSIN